MEQPLSIRILATSSNDKGDLFGRLMTDLFVSLGYEQPRLNVHKSGRELDLTADHRVEKKTAVAECKATSELTGGDEVNKFVGALDAEKKGRAAVVGYFVSLSGFRETAIEQERQGRRTKIHLLGPRRIIEELVSGRALVSREHAAELAGRCSTGSAGLCLEADVELIGHQRGWIWVVYYAKAKFRSHFALIHADGTVIASEIAREVIAADAACGGNLDRLHCLNPEPSGLANDETLVTNALEAYKKYIASECGYIQLDGLPADSEVGSRRMRLEQLFVPIHFELPKSDAESSDLEPRGQRRLSFARLLEVHSKIALLAAPGGGKSTLLKRLAVAYSDPKRKDEAQDGLPDGNWLPLFFRCRELRDLTRGSFSDLLDSLCQREPVRQYRETFRAYIDEQLLAGNVLLLVDGLDEISDPGDRAAFVSTLRTALLAYSDITFIATSREAGFRHVASHLAPFCGVATLSEFNSDDVKRLCIAWHLEVVGDTQKVRHDADQLATSISESDRVSRLVANPLLLTTLLLVKRWVGSLPTKRAVLYGKAVEVLLMTWNTEGHEPIADEEALPQLCYVASSMMLAGTQSISRSRLARYLKEARDFLQTELGYVKGSVEDFIHRVEDRSSLLMMTGLNVEDGQLAEFFEFRHLTFQEFLTARAMVEGWHPRRKPNDVLATVLKPHFHKSSWQQVIPLAAVLGGKETEGLIAALTNEIKRRAAKESPTLGSILTALGNCLSDEAAAKPATIQAALRSLIQFDNDVEHSPYGKGICTGKYGSDLRREAREALTDTNCNIALTSTWIAEAVWHQNFKISCEGDPLRALRWAEEKLSEPDIGDLCEGGLLIMFMCYASQHQDVPLRGNETRRLLRRIASVLAHLLDHSALAVQNAACWAIAWMAPLKVISPELHPVLLTKLFSIRQMSPILDTRRYAGWAFADLPYRSQNFRLIDSISRDDVLSFVPKIDAPDFSDDPAFVLQALWYSKAVDEDELRYLIAKAIDGKKINPSRNASLRKLIEEFGFNSSEDGDVDVEIML